MCMRSAFEVHSKCIRGAFEVQPRSAEVRCSRSAAGVHETSAPHTASDPSTNRRRGSALRGHRAWSLVSTYRRESCGGEREGRAGARRPPRARLLEQKRVVLVGECVLAVPMRQACVGPGQAGERVKEREREREGGREGRREGEREKERGRERGRERGCTRFHGPQKPERSVWQRPTACAPDVCNTRRAVTTVSCRVLAASREAVGYRYSQRNCTTAARQLQTAERASIECESERAEASMSPRPRAPRSLGRRSPSDRTHRGDGRRRARLCGAHVSS